MKTLEYITLQPDRTWTSIHKLDTIDAGCRREDGVLPQTHKRPPALSVDRTTSHVPFGATVSEVKRLPLPPFLQCTSANPEGRRTTGVRKPVRERH